MHRVLTQVYRNFDRSVPEPGDLGEADRELIDKAEVAMGAVAESIGVVRLREALNTSMALARDANRYLDAQAPWKQVKTDKAAAGRTLYTAMQALMALRITLYPFLPFSAQRLHEICWAGMAGYRTWAGVWRTASRALRCRNPRRSLRNWTIPWPMRCWPNSSSGRST